MEASRPFGLTRGELDRADQATYLGSRRVVGSNVLDDWTKRDVNRAARGEATFGASVRPGPTETSRITFLAGRTHAHLSEG